MNILLSFVCMIMGLIIYFVARSNVKKYNYKGIDKLQEYLGVVTEEHMVGGVRSHCFFNKKPLMQKT